MTTTSEQRSYNAALKRARRAYLASLPKPGQPVEEPRVGVAAEARFWAWVNVDGDCWEWQGTRNHFGYGTFHLGGKRGWTVLSHRYSWEFHFGALPAGLCVLHHCDNPPCVNPAHLWLGTLWDNNADRDRKGRNGNGSLRACQRHGGLGQAVDVSGGTTHASR